MNDATMQHLASLSKSLNDASDILSKHIAEAESAFNELRLGLWAWVLVARYLESEDVIRVVRLGYGKLAGRWGLLLSEEYEGEEPKNVTTKPLRDAPRVEKLAAVEKLPELLNALEAQARDVTAETTRKAAQVKEFAAALSKIAR